MNIYRFWLTEGVLNQSPRIQRDDCSLLLWILTIMPSNRYYSHVPGEEMKLSVLVYLIPLIHTSSHPSVCSFTHSYIHSPNIWRSPNVSHHRSWGYSCEKGTQSHQRGHVFLNTSPQSSISMWAISTRALLSEQEKTSLNFYVINTTKFMFLFLFSFPFRKNNLWNDTL